MDPPWTPAQRVRRNPELWDESESWKSKPLVGEIVLLVTADKSKVQRIDYRHLKDPELLQAWLLATLDQDGVAVADELRARVAVRQQIRAAGRELYADDATPHGKQRKVAFAAAIDAATSPDLAPADEADEQLQALQRDDAADRADAKIVLHRLLAACDDLGVEAKVREPVTAAQKGGRLVTTAQLCAAQACLRVVARQQAERKPPTGELRQELAELGVALPTPTRR